MTCIVGVVDGDRVWMGGDSAGTKWQAIRTIATPKVFHNGPFLIGHTNTWRFGNLLQHKLDTSELTVHLDRAADIHQFMVTRFVEAIRSVLSTAGYSQREDNREYGGTCLIGVRGRLFLMEDNYQIFETADGHASCGCGEDYATAALHALGHIIPAEERVKRALETAAYLSTGVRGPFTILSVGGAGEPS